MNRMNRVLPEVIVGGIVGAVGRVTDGDRRVSVHVTKSKSGERANVAWFRNEIKEKVCNRFVLDERFNSHPYKDDHQNGPKAEEICCCGYSYEVHSEQAKENAESSSRFEWNDENDTSVQPTTAFGELVFVGHGQKSKFARVDNNTSQEILRLLLLEQWQLKEPSALISVTGGAQDFTMKSDLERVVHEGVMKAVMTTSAWVITGGMHAGVMKVVGEALTTSDFVVGNKNKATVIGIAPWGCVADREELISEDGKWPAEYDINFSEALAGECFLDMNHSHFILVDNGTNRKFHTEIALRAELEAAIGKVENNSVPRVCVLLEGGPGSLETVKSAIEKDTPVIVVSGSGGIADILTYAVYNAETEESEENDTTNPARIRLKLSDETRKQVRIMLRIMFGSSSKESLNKWVNWVGACIKNKDMITIFSMDSASCVHKDMDSCILSVLLKAKTGLYDKLKTVLTWNRIDIAKAQIFKDNKWRKFARNNDEVNELFIELIKDALKEGREEFVLLFLENGMNVRQNLNAKLLENLYCSVPQSSPLYKTLRGPDKSHDFKLSDVGSLIKKLIDDYKPLYSNRTFHRRETFSEPSRELFIWAVLMNLKTLATHFWEDVSSPIAGALTACEMLRGMAKLVDKRDEKKRYAETAEEFEAMAVAVLQESYAANDEIAEYLLIREQPNFGETTCLELARQGSLEVVAHPCTQMLLDRIWNGKLKTDSKLWRVLVSIPCFFFIFFLIDFREDSHDTTGKMSVFEKSANATTNETREQSTTEEHGERTDANTEEREERNSQNNDSVKDDDEPEKLDFDDIGRPLKPWERLKYFYTAPRVVFTINCIFYLAFLCLFSYDLMVHYSPKGAYGIEIFLLVWVLSLLLEEIRQSIGNCTSAKTLIYSYLSNHWNINDILAILLFVFAFLMRFTSETFEVGRYVMCLSLFLFFIRLMHIFSVFKEIGPTLIMIRRMLIDLLSFLLIIAVFFFAYGVVRQAILYPESKFSNGMLVYTLMRTSYWQMFGEIGQFMGETEEVEKDGITTCHLQDGVLDNCDARQLIVPIVKGIYILFINVLMFNLLIAIFNHTYTTVHENNDKVWSFQRYSLITEYYDRPVAPPPLIIFNHFWLFVQWLRNRKKRYSQRKRKNLLKLTFETHEEKLRERELIAWENENADEYRRKRLIERETNEGKNRMHEKMDHLQSKVDSVTERMRGLEAELKKSNESLERILRHLTSESGGRSLRVHMSPSERMRRAVRTSIDPQTRQRWPDLIR